MKPEYSLSNEEKSQIEEIEISALYTSISDWCFNGCSNLKKVVIPKTITKIGACAFGNCSSLTTISIPKSVVSIGYGAFLRCKSLSMIVIPSSITIVDARVFTGCISLVNVVLPDTLKKIGESAFQECSSLRNIKLPSSLTTIENYAFLNSGIIKIAIPMSVKEIGEDAFPSGCKITKVKNDTKSSAQQQEIAALKKKIASLQKDNENLKKENAELKNQISYMQKEKNNKAKANYGIYEDSDNISDSNDENYDQSESDNYSQVQDSDTDETSSDDDTYQSSKSNKSKGKSKRKHPRKHHNGPNDLEGLVCPYGITALQHLKAYKNNDPNEMSFIYNKNAVLNEIRSPNDLKYQLINRCITSTINYTDKNSGSFKVIPKVLSLVEAIQMYKSREDFLYYYGKDPLEPFDFSLLPYSSVPNVICRILQPILTHIATLGNDEYDSYKRLVMIDLLWVVLTNLIQKTRISNLKSIRDTNLEEHQNNPDAKKNFMKEIRNNFYKKK